MKKLNILLLITFLISANLTYAQPDWQHAIHFGGYDLDTKLHAFSVNNNGEYGVGGSFFTEIEIIENQTTVAYFQPHTPGTHYNGFVVKFNISGEYLWHKVMLCDAGSNVRAITYDDNRDMYITGNFSGELNLGDGFTFNSDDDDVYIAKLDGIDGTTLWVKTGIGTGHQSSYDIAINDQYVYLAGAHYEGITFDTETITSNGSKDIYVAKFNADNGEIQWLTNAGSAGTDEAKRIICDAENNIYICGYFKGTVTFGTVDITEEATGDNGDMFIAKLNPGGEFTNAKAIKSTGYFNGAWYESVGMDCDNNNNVYIAGQVANDIDFGDGIIDIEDSKIGFLVKFDNNLSHQWNKIITPTNTSVQNSANDVKIDDNGNICVFGSFKGIIHFGDGVILIGSVGTTGTDPFLVKYDNTGTALWAEGLLRTENNGGYSNPGYFIDMFNNSVAVAGIVRDPFVAGNFTISAPENASHIFVVSEIVPTSTENDILSFTLAEQAENAVIDNTNHMVEIIVVSGTNITDLTPTIAISDFASISPDSGTPQDFTNPVEYTVTAENNDEQIWTVTVDIETGILNSVINHFLVYPNPSNGILYFNLKESERPLRVEITNINGKTIYTSFFSDLKSENQIDLSNHPKGIYFITIETSKSTYTRKLSIQ